jgi:hypothetical protein
MLPRKSPALVNPVPRKRRAWEKEELEKEE